MRSARCCRLREEAAGTLRPVGFGSNLIKHTRAAVEDNCTICLESYEAGLPPGDATPFVDARFRALGLIGQALQSIVHSNKGADVHERLTVAVRGWPGPSHADGKDHRWVPAHHEPPPAPERQTGLADWRAWLAGLGVPLDLVYLCCALLGHQVPSNPHTARFMLVEAQHGHEPWDAWFHVAFVERENATGAVLPDASRLLQVRIDPSFLDAVRHARDQVISEQLLDRSLDVLWWVKFAHGERPMFLRDVSVGLAAGVAMAGRSPEARKVPTHWFFSGSVEDFDSDDELADAAPLMAKYNHLRSARPEAQLIVPQPALTTFQREMGPVLRIKGVRSVREVSGLAADPSARSRLLLPFGNPALRPVSPWTLNKLERVAVAAEEGGAAALVTGAPGTGKSDLLRTLREGMSDRWIVAHHRCDLYRPVRRVFAPFRDLLEQLRRCLREEDRTDEALVLDALLHDLEAPFSASPDVDRFRFRRGSIGRRLFERITSTLGELSKNRPIALFLDDLHWADETSQALFRHLAGSIHGDGRRLLLVGGMHLEAGQEHPDLLNETGTCVDMEALPAERKKDRVRAALARGGCTQPDPDLVQLLLERAGANILHLQLTVNWLQGTGKLSTERGRWALVDVDARDVPDIDDIIRWFVVGYGPGGTEETLRHAAVIGRELSLDTLRRTTGNDPHELEQLLEHSELVQVMNTKDKSRPSYEFLHPSFAVWIQNNLDDDKSLLHRNVASAYEAELAKKTGRKRPWHTQQPHVDEDVCHLLALHWQQGGRPDLAVEHWMDLAVRDRRCGAYDTALRDREQEVACRHDHTPSDPDAAREWHLQQVDALVDQATIYGLRLRDEDDLGRADEAIDKARRALRHVLESSVPGTHEGPERLPGASGALWWLESARAEAEAGEIARLRNRLDQAQACLEAAMHWGERLRMLASEHDDRLRRPAWRVLAVAGCRLMTVYTARAMRYLKHEANDEDARRAQEVRAMYLCTRLLALSQDPLFQGSPEAAELRVRVLYAKGNVFFWFEGHTHLAEQYYIRARDLLRQTSPSAPTAVGAPVGSADEDVYNMLARLRLSLRDLPGAIEEYDTFQRWADDVGAREHQAAAAYTAALIHTVVATASEPWRSQWGIHGSLDEAAARLETAIQALLFSPEPALRALLLRRWIAARPERDEDPTIWDQHLRLALKSVWGEVPEDLLADPAAHLYCELVPEVGWWVEEQVNGQPLGPTLRAALERYRALGQADDDTTGTWDNMIDLPDEIAARVRALLSRSFFRDRVQAVAEKVEQLRRLHYPGDEKRCMLQCAALIHDCLIERSSTELERLAEDWEITDDRLVARAHPDWLHGLLGHRLIEQELAERFENEGDEGFKRELLAAIKFHSWPGIDMAPSTQLFYVAVQLVKPELAHQVTREVRANLERLASGPATLRQAVMETARLMVARRQARGQTVHPRTVELLHCDFGDA
ncbi:MAG: AAA family ATPase [Egibacteraceae bacterium]